MDTSERNIPTTPSSNNRNSISNDKLRLYFRDMVSTFHQNSGLQTLIFHSLAILFSITILFLLSQIYYIFLPCLKALLWALLCGSALYPFKIRLEFLLKKWLDDLNENNRSLFLGCLVLPAQVLICGYSWTINFFSRNKTVFLLFHFRVQIASNFQIFGIIFGMILSMTKSVIFFSIMICIFIPILFEIIKSPRRTIQKLFSFNFIPSMILAVIFYCIMDDLGIFGHIILIISILLFVIGFVNLIYDYIHGNTVDLNPMNNFIREHVNNRIERFKISMNEKFARSTDSIDGNGSNMGKLFMGLLFTISIFAIIEHMKLSNLMLVIYCIHIVLKKIFTTIRENFSGFVQIIETFFINCYRYMADKFEKDLLINTFLYFFTRADNLIKANLQRSLDLLTSIGLFMIMALMVVFFVVFLSIKV